MNGNGLSVTIAPNSPFRLAGKSVFSRGLVVAALKVYLSVFFGFLSFHFKSQLLNIVKFSLPGNWAFWSEGLLFALRTASQITYQQFIHISCGLVAITSPETNFTDRIIPSIFFR